MLGHSVRLRTSLCLLLLALSTGLAAQNGAPASTATPVVKPAQGSQLVINIPRLDSAPKLEDFLDMKPGPGVAQQMTKVENFTQLDPKEGAPAQERTEVYLGYDAKNLYAVWVCFDREPGKIRARMARREAIGPDHDEVQIYLDTFNDKRRSYGFMVNPLGIQLDYIWTDSDGYDTSFDTVWDSRGKVTTQGYVAWMSIPFKSLRFFASEEQTWGILLQRVVPHDNDNSFVPALTRKIQGRLSQEATLKGLHGISPGRNIQLAPYGVARAFRFLDDRDPNAPFFTGSRLGGRIGLDAKVILHQSLVLDLTVSPDFRQVESDEPQNTVNQRFEVFFPEKRPFFQENANFFSTPINLYFTRRIVDPQFGARLTGKLGPWGIGLLAIDDQSPGRLVPDHDPLRRKRAYFTIARITHDLWKQSHVGIIYADREFSADAATACTLPKCLAMSNRVGGVDGRFRMNPRWTTGFQAVASSTDFADGSHLAGPAFEAFSEYQSRKVVFNNYFNDTSSGFRDLTGFFIRPNIARLDTSFLYFFRPEGKHVTDFGPQFFSNQVFDLDGVHLQRIFEPGFFMDLKANTSFQVFKGFSDETLRPSDFSTLPGNTSFHKGYWGVSFNSRYLSWMSFNGFFLRGRQINFNPPAGEPPVLGYSTEANLGATVRPFNRLTIDNSYLLSRLTIPQAHAAAFNFHVVRSKWNYQWNKELSFRAILQYNTVLANPQFSALTSPKGFNADFLVTYLVHPGTAIYVGYNSDLQNLDRDGIAAHSGLFLTRSRFLNDSRQVFVKVSYLFRF